MSRGVENLPDNSVWPESTQPVHVYVHSYVDGASRTFCGVWFFDGCELNTARELVGIEDASTGAASAVLAAVATCEPLLAEGPEHAGTEETATTKTVKTFSAGIIAPFLVPERRRPAGSSKQAVALLLFTDSEYVCKSLAGHARVEINRDLLIPLQVLTKDFNVFVLRCDQDCAGAAAARQLAMQFASRSTGLYDKP